MKARFDFHFDGMEETINRDNRTNKVAKIGAVEVHAEVEYSVQELIELLANSEKSVHEFLGFLKNDLATVIKESSAAFVSTMNTAEREYNARNNAQLVAHAKAWKEATEISGIQIPFQPFCKVTSPTFDVKVAVGKEKKENE